MEEQSILSLSQSANKDNAYYLDMCACVEHRPAYAACIDKIVRRADGRLESIFSTCSVAISKGDCRAKAMRDEEVLKGKSIYFVSRMELQKTIAAADAGTGQITLTPTGSPKLKMTRGVKRAEKTAPEPVVTGGSYADAINASKTDMVPMLPGETMAQYANRVLASMKEAQPA